jgi:hypothetical protein
MNIVWDESDFFFLFVSACEDHRKLTTSCTAEAEIQYSVVEHWCGGVDRVVEMSRALRAWGCNLRPSVVQ